MYSFHSDEEIKHFMNSEVINTSEACQILKCTRQNVDGLVRRNKLIPIKIYPQDKLFFKKDVLKQTQLIYKKKTLFQNGEGLFYMHFRLLELACTKINFVVYCQCNPRGKARMFWVLILLLMTNTKGGGYLMLYFLAYIATLIFIIILVVVLRKNAYKTKIKIGIFKFFSIELNDEKSPGTPPVKE